MAHRTTAWPYRARKPVHTIVRRSLGAVGILISVTACSVENGDSRTVSASDGAQTLAPLREATALGAFTNRDLKESSSAVPSRRTPGVFWTHNDAGNGPILFAFDSAGRDLGTVRVRGSRNRDWEASSAGPCPKGSCLYVGDVGDNLGEQKFVSIFRLVEPAAPGRGVRTDVTIDAVLRFRYPDGAHDVEAMWVSADTSLWFATKRQLRGAGNRNRPSLVYRLPARVWREHAGTNGQGDAGTVAVAELVDSLPIVPTESPGTMVTDAAYSASFLQSNAEPRLAVRTYDRMLVFSTNHSGRPGALVASCSLRALDEAQGEGVAWLPDGRVLLTSEKRGARVLAGRCP